MDRLLSCTVVFIAALTCVARLVQLHAEPAAYPVFRFDLAAACTTGLACIAVAWFLGPSRPGISRCVVGAGLGLLFFDYTLGFALVDPRNIDWLLHDDWAQHFVGWHFYRNAPWAWPPGKFETFWYPVGTAILYTDSLPLVAIPLKLVSAWLPDRFQYIGSWLLLNCMLQGIFGMLLIRRFFSSVSIQALGASLFLLAPAFISRIDHDTLTTQWVLLAALWLCFGAAPLERRTSVVWMILACVAGLVHPYLSMMLLALAVAYFGQALLAGELTFRQVLIRGSVLVAVTLLCWWVSGAFMFRPGDGGVSLGVNNANLLSWFDSQWMSRWFPALPNAGDAQYEGRGYLGFGVFLLLGASAFLAFRRNEVIALSPRPLGPLVLVVAAATLYAFATRFTLGSTVLLDLTPVHTSVFGAFRASGRFIWLSVYLITLLSFVFVLRNGGRGGLVLIAAAVALQVLDLAPLHERSQHLRQPAATPTVLLRDARWQQAVLGRRHIMLIPPPACGVEAAPYLPLSMLAGDHRMTINSGYLARFDERSTFAYCDTLRDDIAAGKRDPLTLYIVSAEQHAAFVHASDGSMSCDQIEGYSACGIGLAQATSPTER